MAKCVDLNNKKEKKEEKDINIKCNSFNYKMTKPQIKQAEKLKRGLKYIS